MNPSFVTLEGLGKSYGKYAAVADVSLAVAKGEALTLLGPSGCGKTTTLRMIAGLETPDEGTIAIAGKTVFAARDRINLPPEQRQIGMVFQSYAIWPHLTAAENVAFPLQVRRMAKAEIQDRVRKALAMVGLAGFEDRPATQVSGGQQQRVALARALVYEPALLLLDEPLSNLDVKLREQMRLELKLLQNRLQLTVINVTHDQTEALSLSDRIAILNHGRIEQLGTPRELYEQPVTPFVRDFLGKSVTLPARIRAVGGDRVTVELAASPESVLDCARPAGGTCNVGDLVDMSVRREALHLKHDTDQPGRTLKGVIGTVLYQGERSECEVLIGGQPILVYLPADAGLAAGQVIELAADALRLWPR